MDVDGIQNSRTGGEEEEPPAQGDDRDSPLAQFTEDAEPLPEPSLVAHALKQIFESEYFRTSTRGRQFLSFVVQYRLENHPEPLKERTIGVALFNRRLDYATGDDSVVRAQAREVRRRLEKYYLAHTQESPLRIELPVGSYTAVFKTETTHNEEPGEASASAHLAVRPAIDALPASEIEGVLVSPKKRFPISIYALSASLICILVLSFFLYHNSAKRFRSPLTEFWAPAMTSSRPLLICLPKPILYRPSVALYNRSAKTPGEFSSEVYRMNHPPNLQPGDALTWGEMVQYYEYGVSKGDVQAAVRFSNFLGHQGKDSEVRIGDGYSYEDLRNSPAVVIGAFSNPWTIEMTSGLHFSFIDDEKGRRIQEQGPSGRSWQTVHASPVEDFGLVTRLLDSNTGQFVVLVAGLEASGSDAAADLIVNRNSLEKALRDAPKDWPQMNVQIVVSTTVKDSSAGPAKVVAVYVW
jgi:hypothetical protein